MYLAHQFNCDKFLGFWKKKKKTWLPIKSIILVANGSDFNFFVSKEK